MAGRAGERIRMLSGFRNLMAEMEILIEDLKHKVG